MLGQALSELFDSPVDVMRSRPLGGGCISEVCWAEVSFRQSGVPQAFGPEFASGDPIELVIKRNAASMVSNFRCEAEGLAAIADTETIRVPKVLSCDVVARESFLVIEYIRSGGRKDFETFGRRLAEMHQASSGDTVGWPTDNFLGSAKQSNGQSEDWVAFFATERLGFQLRWAADQGLADGGLRRDVEAIIERLDDLLSGRDRSTSLLHGDLWSGNYLFDEADQPVLIDPAVYRGCREAEWGMIRWFGSCPAAFESGYQAVYPMPEGWLRRSDVYMLYHQLNHLNLFGGSYAGACRQTAKQILSITSDGH